MISVPSVTMETNIISVTDFTGLFLLAVKGNSTFNSNIFMTFTVFKSESYWSQDENPRRFPCEEFSLEPELSVAWTGSGRTRTGATGGGAR